MKKYISLSVLGICGLCISAFQAHTPDPLIDVVYQFISPQTYAQEFGDTHKLLLSLHSDSAVEHLTIRKSASVPEHAQKIKQFRVWATAYTSHPFETDNTPLITASGSMVRDGIVASNFLPMGTKFTIPAHYGEKIFVVEDRMNARYNGSHTIDIWFASRTDAFQFGRKSLVLELL